MKMNQSQSSSFLRKAACFCGAFLLLAGCSQAEVPSQPVGETSSSKTESSQALQSSQSAESSQATQSASKPEIQSFADWDGTPFLTLDNYPKMDGSTANLPLMAQVLHKVTGVSMEEAEILSSQCSTTPLAWEALARGDVYMKRRNLQKPALIWICWRSPPWAGTPWCSSTTRATRWTA